MPEYRYKTEPYIMLNPFYATTNYPPIHDPIVVAEVRVRGRELDQRLLRLFQELVQKRRTVAGLIDTFNELDTYSPEYKNAEEDYVGIVRQLDRSLLPKMSGYFDKYVLDIDALVWLESLGSQNLSFKEIQEYRNTKIREFIDGTVEYLYHMDPEAVYKDLESLEIGKEGLAFAGTVIEAA
ncbi:hypothetical protein C0995_005183 [Termitomyces sp. Mi166|nr:hypothetical protein C0995_005183 [Termitomyces sp. Mi166\